MAEFCLDCMNEMDGTHYTEKDVELEMDLCEGCGQIKPVVVGFRRRTAAHWRDWLVSRVQIALWKWSGRL